LAQGGAIFSTGGSLTSHSFFLRNTAQGGRGGRGGDIGNGIGLGSTPANGTNGGVASGGGAFVVSNDIIANSTFSSNTVTGGEGGLGGGPYGTRSGHGGQSSGGAVTGGSNCVIVNCTVTMNNAIGGAGGSSGNYQYYAGNGGDALGGGLVSFGDCLAVNLTSSGNTSIRGSATTSKAGGWSFLNGTNGNSYGGSIANTGGVFQIVNSILSGGLSNNCFGTITDLGHNIFSDGTPSWTSGTSLNNTDPLLLPLADNGGPTRMMALRAGSPALNSADCASAPPTDQRGYPRPNGPGCDVGAYEGPGVPELQMMRESSSTNVLRWMAEASRAYRLEETINFAGWMPIATNTANTNGWLDFRIPANTSPRFFRLIAQ
jgi:hypothetical protein